MKSPLIGELLALALDLRGAFGWRLPLLLILMTVVALGEGISMALLLPLLATVGIDGMGGGGLVQDVVRRILSVVGDQPPLAVLLGLITAVLLIQGALFLWQVWWVAELQRRYGALWQRRLFSAFIQARWTFFTGQKLGQLVNAITNEAARLAGALHVLLQMVATVVVTVVYLGIAAALSWMLTAALLAFGIFLFVGVRGIGRRNYRIGMALGPLNAELNILLSEFLGGVKLIKATATESRAIKSVAAVVESLREHHTWATFLPGLVRALFEFLSIVAVCVVLVVGHAWLAIPAASMLLVLALFVRLLPRFNALQQNMQLLATYLPSISQIQAVLEQARAEAEPIARPLSIDLPRNAPLQIDIRCAGYGDVVVLRDLRIDLPIRGFVGIVGDSGAGKSTLIHCLLGLCEIADGDIRAGATSIRSVPLTVWRKEIGYVPQETILFHLSIRENIAWAREDASLDEIREAARRAHADGFIQELPEGYDTVIGDQGLRLSGGQRQRLGIARALITRPRILLLDEATSALDSASEQAVLEGLEDLRAEMCIISVAHRLASVRSADRILVMRHGSIAESGSWEELMGRESTLRSLVAAQQIA